jgi:transcriptional regulator with XRE-family HTH domain
MATFGDRLRTLREQKGETQQDIADLLGVTKHAVSGYERGVRRPAGESALEVYEMLADHFNVDLAYLVGQQDHVVRLLGTGSDPDADLSVEVTPEELALIKAYRRLDPYNKKLTRMAARVEDDKI